LADWPAVVAACDELLALRPDADTWNRRGNALDAQQDHAAAVESYSQAIALVPDQAYLYRNRAGSRLSLGQWAETEADARRAVELEPDRARGWQLVGEACARQARWADAVPAYARWTELAPDSAEAWWALGQAHENQGDWTGALPAYRRVTELAPDFANAWNSLGNAHIGQGDHAAAAEAYSRAIALAPDQAYLYRNRADALIELGRLDQAEADCYKAQALDPQNPRTAGRWGQLRVAQRRFAEAEPLLQTAVAGTSLADWGGWLALALVGQGKVDQAQGVLEAWAQTANPDDRARWMRRCANLGLAPPEASQTSEVSETSEV
jgi:tetratricopeptide (TPR) repeat protein